MVYNRFRWQKKTEKNGDTSSTPIEYKHTTSAPAPILLRASHIDIANTSCHHVTRIMTICVKAKSSPSRINRCRMIRCLVLPDILQPDRKESDERMKESWCSKPLCARKLLDDHDHDCAPSSSEFRSGLLGKLSISLLHQSVEIKCWNSRQMKSMSYQSFSGKNLTYTNSTACISPKD
jgi:hypothetical protein